MPRNDKADKIPEMYLGETAVLLATGPSLSTEDIEYIRPFHARGDVRVFGLNDAYRVCDFMDVFYACDPKWWDCNPEVLKNPCPQKWTQDPRAAPKYDVKLVSGSGGKGLSVAKHHIHYGSNSGFQLLNLAFHYGIRRFLLLGYNMDVPKGKQQHFFGKHPKPLNQSNNYRGFASQYASLSAEHKNMVINCTYPSGLTCFQQMPLEKALGQPKRRIRTSDAVESTPKAPAIPRQTREAGIPGIYGGPRSHRPILDTAAIDAARVPAYGG